MSDIIQIIGIAVDLLTTIVDVILHTAKPCKKKTSNKSRTACFSHKQGGSCLR